MLSVQTLEAAVAWVYLLANYKPSGTAKQVRRQALEGFRSSWAAFQTGTSRMKLNDAARGIKNHLDPDLYEELDWFLSGSRAQLAHRFLVEHLSTPDAVELRAADDPLSQVGFKPGTVRDLLVAALESHRLSRALFDRGEELRSALPDAPEVPPEIRSFVEKLARAAMYKEFSDPLEPPPLAE
jgi:hypothetical protein